MLSLSGKQMRIAMMTALRKLPPPQISSTLQAMMLQQIKISLASARTMVAMKRRPADTPEQQTTEQILYI